MTNKESLRYTPGGWYLNNEPVLNLAAYVSNTKVLGPGNRFGIWVQGCNRRCKGCLAKEWLQHIPNQVVTVTDLTQIILNIPELQGLTISGGEPMLQAAALLKLVLAVKEKKDLDIICYTGYTYGELIQSPPSGEVLDFLKTIDVLIDGEYIETLNNNMGLLGSTNQQVHHFTNRLTDYDFINPPRKVEIHIEDGEIFLVGVPTKEMNTAFEQSIRNFTKKSNDA